MADQPYTQIIGQVNDLPSADRTNFLSQLPQDLTSDEQKHLATTSLDATKDGAKMDVIAQSIKTLPEEDKQTLSNVLVGPSPGIRDQIWMLIVKAFITLVVGSFLVLSASLFLYKVIDISDAHVQIILTVFTTAAAFLTGLLAPSPVGTKQTT